MDDRSPMFGAFKRLVYADSREQLEELFQELKQGDFGTKYVKFGQYMDGVFDLKEDWSLVFRYGVLLRGNQTNNHAEAQFLVMKDTVLQRIKAQNINEFFHKVAIELENHYIVKLLSVASGSFDVVIGKRYKGKQTKKGELGFTIPEAVDAKRMLDGVSHLGDNLYSVPSCSNPHSSYLVDMTTGLCQCRIGQDGSPCKHQYILWENRICGSPNFVPFHSAKDRMHFAKLATQSNLEPEMYEGVHDRVLNIERFEACQSAHSASSDMDVEPIQEEPQDHSDSSLEHKREEARECLHRTMDHLAGLIDSADPSLLKGLVVFSEKVSSMNTSQLASTLHKFGKAHFSAKNSLSSSLLKRAQRFKIGVQPTAIARRKSEFKGKRALPRGGKTSEMIPVKLHTKKRPHYLAGCVSKSQKLGITHEKLMKSRVPNKCQKKSTVKDEGALK